MARSILLCFVLLLTEGLSQHQDRHNNFRGPGNLVINGKKNSLFGSFNIADGFDNLVKGKLNFARGDRNSIIGKFNSVFSSDSLVRGNHN